MSDKQLAEIILKVLRDSRNATHMQDIREIARAHGVTVHYQAQRVAERLRDQGWIEDAGFNDQALPALITDHGLAALASGAYAEITDRAVSDLEAGGRTAEAKGEV